jgi:HEAT repeat protein
MPTPTEIRVMRLLTVIDAAPTDMARGVMAEGTAGVTVVCEAALASYPGLREKVRMNAIALLGWLDHPQARETAVLLVEDPDRDAAIRAIRSVGRQHDDQSVPALQRILTQKSTDPIVAAEAVKALASVGSERAASVLGTYRKANEIGHRGSAVVREVLDRLAQ